MLECILSVSLINGSPTHVNEIKAPQAFWIICLFAYVSQASVLKIKKHNPSSCVSITCTFSQNRLLILLSSKLKSHIESEDDDDW